MSIRDNYILPSTFNRRITVKTANTSVDSGGGVSTSSYTTRFTTWAYLESMSTNRKVYLGFDAFENVYEGKMRFDADRTLTTADLIDYLNGNSTETLQIISVQLYTQGYKKFLLFNAKEVTPQG